MTEELPWASARSRSRSCRALHQDHIDRETHPFEIEHVDSSSVRASQFTRSPCCLLTRHNHLGAQTAEHIIEELFIQTPEVIEDAYRTIPDGFPQDVADSILQGMQRQLDTLQAQIVAR